jgi:hypothetical protein
MDHVYEVATVGLSKAWAAFGRSFDFPKQGIDTKKENGAGHFGNFPQREF